ncbi:MAG: hypothetical protein ORN98_07995 [Alphaproteobacteria bacterium]|nr:hypothetical protein [Alphaproteobacteria bacterium]
MLKPARAALYNNLRDNETIDDHLLRNGVEGAFGTLGYGLDYHYAVNNNIAIRGGLSYLPYSFNKSMGSGQTQMSFAAQMISPEIMVDYYPFAVSGLYLSAGAISPLGNMQGFASSGTVKLLDQQFDGAKASISVMMSQVPILNYAGIGVTSWPSARGDSSLLFGMRFETGAMWIQPKVTGKIDCSQCHLEDVGVTFSDIEQAYQNEIINTASRHFGKISFYPVVRFSVNLLF